MVPGAVLPRVLVRGSGDVGSAVAHTLFTAGYSVAIHDGRCPTTSRRTMAFVDAIFDGRATLAGVTATRVDDLRLLDRLLAAHAMVPAVVTELDALLHVLQPILLIDARMRKRAVPEVQRHLAPLTIGLGPNYLAGSTTHWVVETSWGEDLGQVLTEGTPKPLAGEPRPIAGYGRERFVYAPTRGVFRTHRQIGEIVAQADVIADIDGTVILQAPLAGVLRGLTHTGVPVEVGTKVIEVDPRGMDAVIDGLGERPRRIAAGILEALQHWQAPQE